MKKILYLLVATIGISACSTDMLDISDPSSFTPETLYKNQKDMEAAVIGTYGCLRGFYSNPLTVNIRLYYWGEERSDNSGFYSPTIDKYQVDNFLPLFVDNMYIDNTWNSAYRTIINANIVLEKVDGANYNDGNLKKQHIGEAKLIRALSYFYLARIFGGYALNVQLLGVPKVTKHISANEARIMPRASLEDIYALIVSDLTDAKANLPASYAAANAGRFTSVGAQALLGKVYMFMAGYPLKKGNDYYTKAIAEFTPVINNPQFSLVSSYVNLFKAETKNTSEALIEIQFKSDISKLTGNSFQSLFMSNAASSALVATGGGGVEDNKPTPSIINAYAPGDPRKSVTLRPGYKEKTGNWKNEAYSHKYWQDVVGYYNDWGCNWKELRLAEVYLLYAEALVRTGGDKGVAVQYLNKIRQRARNTSESEDPSIAIIEAQYPTWNNGDPTVTLQDYKVADFATDDDLLLAIENETRVEFAFESNRWYNLVRTERANKVMTKELKDDSNIDLIWNDRDYAIPIPQSAMITAPGALIQNVGYVQM